VRGQREKSGRRLVRESTGKGRMWAGRRENREERG